MCAIVVLFLILAYGLYLIIFSLGSEFVVTVKDAFSFEIQADTTTCKYHHFLCVTCHDL